MALVAIFLIGLGVGFIAQRYAFCIFGSLVELLTLGSLRRLVAVVTAMIVFGLVHIGEYRHTTEYPGMIFLAGGVVQGMGYYLAAGCPLGLLVRIGEGSKFHLIVFVGFAVGLAAYVGLLHKPITTLLSPFSTQKVITVLDLFR
jgi:uncharacterized membrane protein YedE/YeeE